MGNFTADCYDFVTFDYFGWLTVFFLRGKSLKKLVSRAGFEPATR